jgi:hypothetical protein
MHEREKELIGLLTEQCKTLEDVQTLLMSL